MYGSFFYYQKYIHPSFVAATPSENGDDMVATHKVKVCLDGVTIFHEWPLNKMLRLYFIVEVEFDDNTFMYFHPTGGGMFDVSTDLIEFHYNLIERVMESFEKSTGGLVSKANGSALAVGIEKLIREHVTIDTLSPQVALPKFGDGWPYQKVLNVDPADPGPVEGDRVVRKLDMNEALTTMVEFPCLGCEDLFDSTLYRVIIHLNDFHKWSREKIADWLDELHDTAVVDLTMKEKK